ncbi:hypothetical protein [Chloroflexus sp.]|uniref:hypothetical protein n=1 Tax=Chloroflexus sp. TaxID=1904827 RepID=UPI00298F0117|nr:hypothetical protein [Chloroflexus sp.]MDW8404151.1 hypothetical protein [Chloroflexus sp.]
MKTSHFDRYILYAMKVVSLASLACYTATLYLCRQEVNGHQPERAALRSRLANVAHALDWLMNVMVAVVGVGRLFRDEHFGGQYQPRWLKIYFMITGPLPTIGMVGAMITGHRWGESMRNHPQQQRLHRLFAWIGYFSWWLSVIPIFFQPLLNRLAAKSRDTTSVVS